MSDNISFDCQPNNTQKAISSVYSELLSSNDKLNLRPAYQRSLVWSNDQKSYYIDTIMNNCPSPIFLLYMYDPDEEYECVDGQNRLTTIKQYIEQDGTNGKPFSWKVETDQGEEHIYYQNEKTKTAIEAFCEEHNKKGKRKHKTYRLMTTAEMRRFNKYELTLSQIKSKLSFEQRQEIFMRWQNGTGISQCDSFKNERYPYCIYVVDNNIDRTLVDVTSNLLKARRNNWIWDIYLLFNAFQKDELKDIILASITVKNLIKNDKTSSTSQFKDMQTKLEKFLPKLKPLESLRNTMYISFILGYIYLWRKCSPQVRFIAEKEDFLIAFAKESLENDDHSHSTLNNVPQVKDFINSFPKFTSSFYALIDEFTPPPTTPQPKKRETIPAGVKNDVWNVYIGKEKGEGECFCCGKKCISQREFHTGHIIPDRDGGKPVVENLRPVCGPCNQSMGVQNMLNYIRKHYPQQVQRFNDSIGKQ